jgi:hypothetical protein
LVVLGIPTRTNCSSKMMGSMGLIRGKPSERSVASMQRFSVAVCLRTKISAILGASAANSVQATIDTKPTLDSDSVGDRSQLYRTVSGGAAGKVTMATCGGTQYREMTL